MNLQQLCSIFYIGLVGSSQAFAVDFSHVPVARTVEESKQLFEQRLHAVEPEFLAAPIGAFIFKQTTPFIEASLVRLAHDTKVDEVNRAILDPNTKAYSQPGTDFRILGPICRREGDYDFRLASLINLVLLNWDHPTHLWPDTKDKLLKELLTVRGTDHPLRVKLGLCGWFDETENHVLMTETTRYLTNQLLLKEALLRGKYLAQFDNSKNGFNEWILKRLQRFVQNDFYEYNSKPYQAYSVQALENLYNHAGDSKVKLGAQIVLDYLSAKFATQSNDLRRLAPFRRLSKNRDLDPLIINDSESLRHAVLAGNFGKFANLAVPFILPSGSDRMLHSGMGSYRVPDLILDMIIHKDHFPYYQRFRHDGAEIYASSKSFLISGGGVFTDAPDFFTGLIEGWAMPTILMPSVSGMLRSELIQIAGHKSNRKKFNLCVAPGFACGLNPVIPKRIPASGLVRVADWVFVNFKTYYVAVYSARCDSALCKSGAKTFGFFEAAEAGKVSFDEFRHRVIANNGWRTYRSRMENTYVTTEGNEIRFVPVLKKRDEWNIRAINGVVQSTNIKNWGLAQGTVLNAGRNGLVTVDNPYLNQRLVLDLSNPLNPNRRIEELK